jgi:hypothetical protein
VIWVQLIVLFLAAMAIGRWVDATNFHWWFVGIVLASILIVIGTAIVLRCRGERR